jgi:hypothetical protein
VLSRTWQASFSRSHRWQDFSVHARWQQRSTDSVRGSNERDRGIYFNLSLTRLQRGHDSSGQRRYAVDVRQPQHQRPAIDYSVGQSLRQDRDTHYRELNAELRANNSDRYSAAQRPAAERHRQHRRQHRTISSAAAARPATAAAQLRLRTGPSWFLLERCQRRRGRPGRAGGRFRRCRPAGVAAELQVGGLRRQRLQIGERRLLPLSSYQSHRAEVQDASTLDSIAAIRVTGVGGARPMFLPRQADAHAGADRSDLHLHRQRQGFAGALGGARILNAPVPGTSANGSFVADFRVAKQRCTCCRTTACCTARCRCASAARWCCWWAPCSASRWPWPSCRPRSASRPA